MEIGGKRVLILGGSGLVGAAVARELSEYGPEEIVICGLTREEAESAVAELKAAAGPGSRLPRVEAEWGDVFLPDTMIK